MFVSKDLRDVHELFNQKIELFVNEVNDRQKKAILGHVSHFINHILLTDSGKRFIFELNQPQPLENRIAAAQALLDLDDDLIKRAHASCRAHFNDDKSFWLFLSTYVALPYQREIEARGGALVLALYTHFYYHHFLPISHQPYVEPRLWLTNGVVHGRRLALQMGRTLVEQVLNPEHQQTVIYGNVGCGKTRMLIEASFESWMRYAKDESAFVPWFVPAGKLSSSSKKTFLKRALMPYADAMDYPQAVKTLLQLNLFLVIDGLDELPADDMPTIDLFEDKDVGHMFLAGYDGGGEVLHRWHLLASCRPFTLKYFESFVDKKLHLMPGMPLHALEVASFDRSQINLYMKQMQQLNRLRIRQSKAAVIKMLRQMLHISGWYELASSPLILSFLLTLSPERLSFIHQQLTDGQHSAGMDRQLIFDVMLAHIFERHCQRRTQDLIDLRAAMRRQMMTEGQITQFLMTFLRHYVQRIAFRQLRPGYLEQKIPTAELTELQLYDGISAHDIEQDELQLIQHMKLMGCYFHSTEFKTFLDRFVEASPEKEQLKLTLLRFASTSMFHFFDKHHVEMPHKRFLEHLVFRRTLLLVGEILDHPRFSDSPHTVWRMCTELLTQESGNLKHFVLNSMANATVEEITAVQRVFCNMLMSAKSFPQADCQEQFYAYLAANLVTCLAYMDFDFSDMDLSKLDLTGADLSYAHMPRVNFSNSILRQVQFNGAFLRDAVFADAVVDDVFFGLEDEWGGRLSMRPHIFRHHKIRPLINQGFLGHSLSDVVVRVSPNGFLAVYALNTGRLIDSLVYSDWYSVQVETLQVINTVVINQGKLIKYPTLMMVVYDNNHFVVRNLSAQKNILSAPVFWNHQTHAVLQNQRLLLVGFNLSTAEPRTAGQELEPINGQAIEVQYIDFSERLGLIRSEPEVQLNLIARKILAVHPKGRFIAYVDQSEQLALAVEHIVIDGDTGHVAHQWKRLILPVQQKITTQQLIFHPERHLCVLIGSPFILLYDFQHHMNILPVPIALQGKTVRAELIGDYLIMITEDFTVYLTNINDLTVQTMNLNKRFNDLLALDLTEQRLCLNFYSRKKRKIERVDYNFHHWPRHQAHDQQHAHAHANAIQARLQRDRQNRWLIEHQPKISDDGQSVVGQGHEQLRTSEINMPIQRFMLVHQADAQRYAVVGQTEAGLYVLIWVEINEKAIQQLPIPSRAEVLSLAGLGDDRIGAGYSLDYVYDKKLIRLNCVDADTPPIPNTMMTSLRRVPMVSSQSPNGDYRIIVERYTAITDQLRSSFWSSSPDFRYFRVLLDCRRLNSRHTLYTVYGLKSQESFELYEQLDPAFGATAVAFKKLGQNQIMIALYQDPKQKQLIYLQSEPEQMSWIEHGGSLVVKTSDDVLHLYRYNAEKHNWQEACLYDHHHRQRTCIQGATFSSAKLSRQLWPLVKAHGAHLTHASPSAFVSSLRLQHHPEEAQFLFAPSGQTRDKDLYTQSYLSLKKLNKVENRFESKLHRIYILRYRVNVTGDAEHPQVSKSQHAFMMIEGVNACGQYFIARYELASVSDRQQSAHVLFRFAVKRNENDAHFAQQVKSLLNSTDLQGISFAVTVGELQKVLLRVDEYMKQGKTVPYANYPSFWMNSPTTPVYNCLSWICGILVNSGLQHRLGMVVPDPAYHLKDDMTLAPWISEIIDNPTIVASHKIGMSMQ